MTETARFKITIENEGHGPVNNAVIEAWLHDKLAYDSASEKVEPVGDKVAWMPGTIAPGAVRTLDLLVKAKETGTRCLTVRGLLEGEQSTPPEKACVTFVGSSSVHLDLYDRRDPIPLGEDTSYPIWVLNQGHIPITNLRLQATISGGMDLVRVQGGKYQVNGKNINFEPLGALDPGAKAEYEVFVKTLLPGDLRFKVELSADQLKAEGPLHAVESTTVFELKEDQSAVPGKKLTPRPDKLSVILDRE